MGKRLLLIRHAAIEGSEKPRLVGATDVPASPQGVRDLERLSGVLKGYRPDAWFCSPLLRARQTMAKLGEYCGTPQDVAIDERLREINFGRWEMKSFADIVAGDQEMIAGWTEYNHFTFPDGEPVAAFCARVAAVLAELRASLQQEIAVVTHGGVIRTLICQALGLPPKQYLLFDVRPGSLTVLDLHPEGAVLAGLNL